MKKVDSTSEKGDQTNLGEKENLKSLKAKLITVKGRITRALNKIEPAVDKICRV